MTREPTRQVTPELDSLTHPDTLSFPRFFGARPLLVPRLVWREGDWLKWRTSALPREVHDPSPGLMLSFLELRAASDPAILRFARKFGPLGICEHGLPHTHGARFIGPDFCLLPAGCRPMGHYDEGLTGGHERFEDWRRYAREAYVVLRAAAKLHEDGISARLPAAVQEVLLSGLREGAKAPNWTTAKKWVWVHWPAIQTAVDRWIEHGNVRPCIDMQWTLRGGEEESVPRLGLRIGTNGASGPFACGLFGILASQLLLLACGGGNLAICDFCGNPFSPARAGRPGTRRLCPEHSNRRYWNLLAQRDKRARDRLRRESRRRPGTRVRRRTTRRAK